MTHLLDTNSCINHLRHGSASPVSTRLLGPNDLMIASIARAHRLTLVTHNVGEFSRVPRLLDEDWQIP